MYNPQASNRLHFYTWTPKLGTVFVTTNYAPFQDDRVQGKWLEDLWGDHKLSHDDYESLSLRVRLGHSTHKRDHDLVRALERDRGTRVFPERVRVLLGG